MHRFTMKCPKCNQISYREDEADPKMYCGDCLMNDMEVVQLVIVRVSLLAPAPLRSR